jgi:hypothetical protein
MMLRAQFLKQTTRMGDRFSIEPALYQQLISFLVLQHYLSNSIKGQVKEFRFSRRSCLGQLAHVQKVPG